MKRALFVSYYFPPLGGVGALRPLKFAKYLGAFGWQVDVLTVDPKLGLKFDSSLAKDIPAETRVRAAPTGETRLTALDRFPFLKYWRLLFWPDAAVLWKAHATRLGRLMNQDRRYDLVFSSAPPYSAHLIAETLQRDLDVPWVADFRDPWSQNRSLHRLQPWRKGLDRMAEARILSKADHVIAVTETLREDLLRDFSVAPEHVTTLPNGFDPEEFPPAPRPQNETLTLLYAGSAYGDYNPMAMLEGLERVARDRPELRFRVRLVGAVSQWMRAHAASQRFSFAVELVDYLPHAAMPAEMQGADLLLLFCPERLRVALPAKLFEYLAAERPILALLPADSEADRLVRESGCGTVVNDPGAVADAFSRCLDDWQQGRLLARPNPDLLRRFDRRQQAGELAALFDRIVEKRAIAMEPSR